MHNLTIQNKFNLVQSFNFIDKLIQWRLFDITDKLIEYLQVYTFFPTYKNQKSKSPTLAGLLFHVCSGMTKVSCT